MFMAIAAWRLYGLRPRTAGSIGRWHTGCSICSACVSCCPPPPRLGTSSFEDHDEIYSWNMWGVQHALGEQHDLFYTVAPYPQTFSYLIAWSYQLLGSIDLQTPGQVRFDHTQRLVCGCHRNGKLAAGHKISSVVRGVGDLHIVRSAPPQSRAEKGACRDRHDSCTGRLGRPLYAACAYPGISRISLACKRHRHCRRTFETAGADLADAHRFQSWLWPASFGGGGRSRRYSRSRDRMGLRATLACDRGEWILDERWRHHTISPGSDLVPAIVPCIEQMADRHTGDHSHVSVMHSRRPSKTQGARVFSSAWLFLPRSWSGFSLVPTICALACTLWQSLHC